MLEGLIRRAIEEETALINRAIGGDPRADQEVIARAWAGSLRCQRAIIDVLDETHRAGIIDGATYVDRAEPFCRMAAQLGEWQDRQFLACLLRVKVQAVRERGGPEDSAQQAEAEMYQILDRLCDEGDDAAFAILASLDAVPTSVEAITAASTFRKITAPDAGPPPPAIPLPPLEPEPERSLGDMLAKSLSQSAPPTRLERLRWWADDFGWNMKLLWWSLCDRLSAWKARL